MAKSNVSTQSISLLGARTSAQPAPARYRHRSPALQAASRPHQPETPASIATASAPWDQTLAAILAGRPVVFGSRLLIAKAFQGADSAGQKGIVLFAEVGSGVHIKGSGLSWMTVPALTYAIETGFVRLALDEVTIGCRA